jgi:hypothetical protein
MVVAAVLEVPEVLEVLVTRAQQVPPALHPPLYYKHLQEELQAMVELQVTQGVRGAAVQVVEVVTELWLPQLANRVLKVMGATVVEVQQEHAPLHILPVYVEQVVEEEVQGSVIPARLVQGTPLDFLTIAHQTRLLTHNAEQGVRRAAALVVLEFQTIYPERSGGILLHLALVLRGALLHLLLALAVVVGVELLEPVAGVVVGALQVVQETPEALVGQEIVAQPQTLLQ